MKRIMSLLAEIAMSAQNAANSGKKTNRPMSAKEMKKSQPAIIKVIPLVELISNALTRRVTNSPDWKAESSAIVHLFRDFWFYSTVFGLSDASLGWPDSLQKNIQNIARYSPVLTFDENEPMKQRNVA